ncbi:transcription termination factor NusA [Porphyromonas endodontalis]|jgi:transcription termination factor nusA|uniref:transcription termination factor NusA n=1 Tax=Porphyromonas endodontalis TaxID=28124 RepID=UPI00248F071B|nr:transcription termination factor NusA [Porphyromonas endodontalis]
MAQKQAHASMTETLAEFKELKNIDKETLINVLKSAFMSVLSKMFGTDENFTIIVSPEMGDLEIWRNRMVVADGSVQNPNLEISLSDALPLDPDAEIGSEVTDSINFASFGRRAILNLRQALQGKVLELQKENLYKKFQERVGQMVSAEVYQVWKREALLVDDEGNELLLPKSEQIPGDYFRKGESVHAVIDHVDYENNNIKIYVSRTSQEFLKRLFELNVPEIGDGLITIKRVARIPGERAKMAVESYDDRIDPVGACVGMNGSRIRGIVRELKGENIDVMSYTTNSSLFVQRALSPAKVSSIEILPEELKAEVYLSPEEVPMAIGKNASNIKLASALTGYKIEVFRDIEENDEEDIFLNEFNDEIEDWVLEVLKNIGCNTALSVLRIPRAELISKADLEESTVDHVLEVLSSEFDPEELERIGFTAPEATEEVEIEEESASEDSEPLPSESPEA